MHRIERRERWRAWMRRLVVSLLVGVFIAAVLAIPFVGVSTMAVNHPLASQAILRSLVRAVEVGRILWEALAMMMRAFLGQREWIVLSVWLVLVVSLGAGWMRLVLRARRTIVR